MKKIKVIPKTVEKVVEKAVIEEETIVEEPGGWEPLLGKRVLILCAGYFYLGKLTGVNSTCVELSDARVQYDVDDFDPKKFDSKSFDRLPTKGPWRVQLASVESFGEV